jgi:hypothetical protein
MFPQKSYCGEYATILNLTKRPSIRFLRVKCTMNRRAEPSSELLFGFYVRTKPLARRTQPRRCFGA